MRPLLLIGGGGHCRSVIDVIEHDKCFEIAGIVDNNLAAGSHVLGYEVLGSDADLPVLAQRYGDVFICIGQIRTAHVRQELFEYLQTLGFTLPSIISSRAYVSPHATVGKGSIVMHDAVLNANVSVGCNCIINTKALIEHDSVIESHCHIATGAIINGGVRVKQGSFVGSGAVSKEGITIDAQSFIKAGSVVV